ncbi:hypothetical protein, partial [Cohnella sp.]|uniref:hypothetical protein n=1 Tax=Cohnella sp. TaxID=1883426 RepID=UPI00370463F1
SFIILKHHLLPNDSSLQKLNFMANTQILSMAVEQGGLGHVLSEFSQTSNFAHFLMNSRDALRY